MTSQSGPSSISRLVPLAVGGALAVAGIVSARRYFSAKKKSGGTSYKDSGVDIETGDSASRIAYEAAQTTFPSRRGMIGEPVTDEGGFAGLLDMGDFYLVQGDDGVGTKSMIAEQIGKFDTLGFDLLAMVCDDAVCVGAETISMTNTIDTARVNPERMRQLMAGLSKACIEQKIVIPGGEIAELGTLVNGDVWNATAVGVVAKDRLITAKDIVVGDVVISLKERGFRSNGFSLVRKVLTDKFGRSAFSRQFRDSETTIGEEALRPSQIYSAAVLNLIGRYKQERKVPVKAIVHVTGGGIPGNANRVLKQTGLGIELENLHDPCQLMKQVQEWGNVSDSEAYKVWNMGNGMLVFVGREHLEQTLDILRASGVEAQYAGRVIEERAIRFRSRGHFQKDQWLHWTY